MVCVKPEPRLRSNTDSCIPTRDTRWVSRTQRIAALGFLHHPLHQPGLQLQPGALRRAGDHLSQSPGSAAR